MVADRISKIAAVVIMSWWPTRKRRDAHYSSCQPLKQQITKLATTINNRSYPHLAALHPEDHSPRLVKDFQVTEDADLPQFRHHATALRQGLEAVCLLDELNNHLLRIDRINEEIYNGRRISFSLRRPSDDIPCSHDEVASAWARTRARSRAATSLVLEPRLAAILRSD